MTQSEPPPTSLNWEEEFAMRFFDYFFDGGKNSKVDPVYDELVKYIRSLLAHTLEAQREELAKKVDKLRAHESLPHPDVEFYTGFVEAKNLAAQLIRNTV